MSSRKADRPLRMPEDDNGLSSHAASDLQQKPACDSNHGADAVPVKLFDALSSDEDKHDDQEVHASDFYPLVQDLSLIHI